MTIDEALLYLERDDASIRFFSPQDYEAFVTLKKYAKSQQQPCEDCISRAYIESVVEELENICINGDEYILSLLSNIKNAPSVTPQQTRWFLVSKRLPNHDEYIKNNGLFIVSDGNRNYCEWYDIYDEQKFGKPTINGFYIDKCVIAWMPLPEPYKAESEEK